MTGVLTINKMNAMKRKISYLLLLLLIGLTVQAQESNLEKYTPSVLLEKGTWDFLSFYSIYTQTQVRDREGDEVALGQRQSFLNAMYQVTYGVSESGRFNIGFDVHVNRAYYDDDEGSPLNVLWFGEGDFSRTVVSAIGPRIRFVPVPSIPTLSVQSSFLFPVASDLEAPFFTAHDRYTWFTQLFYDLRLNAKWRIFMEVDFLYRLKRNEEQVNFFRTPASAFLSYFPTSRTTLFGFAQYSPRFQNLSNEVEERFGFSNWFTQIGIGGRYQLMPNLSVELAYGNFVASRQDGAGYTLNLGLRYIKQRN